MPGIALTYITQNIHTNHSSKYQGFNVLSNIHLESMVELLVDLRVESLVESRVQLFVELREDS